MARGQTCINLRKETKIKAKKALAKGRFPGISSLSGLVEKTLEDAIEKVEA